MSITGIGEALVEVHRLLRTTYTLRGIVIWLHSRNRDLDGQRPIDLIERGECDAVLEEARRIGGGA